LYQLYPKVVLVDQISHFLNCSTADEEPEKNPPKNKPPPSDAGSGTGGNGGGSGTGESGGGSNNGSNSDGSGGKSNGNTDGGSSDITNTGDNGTNGAKRPNDQKKKAGVLGLIGGAVVVGAVAVAAALRRVSG
jgi:hypothetical protein